MAYENILKSLGAGSTEDYERKVRNYEVFDRLMKEGADLQEIVDRAKAPAQPAIDEGLFSAMETAVREVPEVRAAKKSQDDAVKSVVMRLCASDPDYQKTSKVYRDTVIKAYTEKKGVPPENTGDQAGTHGGTVAERCRPFNLFSINPQYRLDEQLNCIALAGLRIADGVAVPPLAGSRRLLDKSVLDEEREGAVLPLVLCVPRPDQVCAPDCRVASDLEEGLDIERTADPCNLHGLSYRNRILKNTLLDDTT